MHNIMITLVMLSGIALAQQAVVLTVEPGQTTTVGASASAGGSDTDTLTYTGTVNATVTYDAGTLAATGVEFTGGRLFLSDTAMSFNTIVSGFIPVTVTYTGVGISGFWDTPTPAGAVAQPGGGLINTEHAQTIDQGVVTVTAVSFLGTQTETQNFVATPETADIEGTNTLALSQVSGDLWQRTLEVTLTSVKAISETEQLGAPGETVTLTENGTVVAKGQFTVPTDFGAWAAANGLVNPQPSSNGSGGVPHGLLYAFDLPAGESCLPIAVNAAGKVAVTLPVGGLNEDMVPMYSSDLVTWAPLAVSFWDQGAGSFDQGAMGVKTLTFPVSAMGKGFVRFSVTLN